MRHKFFTILTAVLLITPVIAESGTVSEGNGGKDSADRYFLIKKLMTDNLYLAAEKELLEIIPHINPENGISRTDCESMLLMCRIKLKRADIDGLVKDFLVKYPDATERESILLEYGNYYFDRKDYVKALEIYCSTSASSFGEEKKCEYDFKKSYCLMRTGKSEEALKGFTTVMKRGYGKYTAPATYYSAYIKYINKDFEEAIPLFERITSNPTYSEMSRYYLLESHFMLKDYDYVILNGRKLYEEIDREYKLKTARLLSEAYFEKDMPQEAKMFFEIYSTSGINLSRKDMYYSGIISYSLNSYLSALDAFRQTAGKDDAIGQNSYYHMGNCYIKVKNKVSALEAYRNASSLDFDTAVKEISFYNYAKLAFDLHSDISVFNNYLKTFPSSEKSDEIHNYIATAFLLNKDYGSAVKALSEVKAKTPETKANIQKAAFFMGLDLMDRGAFRDAQKHFILSMENGEYNRELKNLAGYWLAEAYFRSDNYTEAIETGLGLISSDDFRTTDEAPQALYNLGYAYLKNGDYQQAEKWFREYLDLSPSRRKSTLDAKIRLADSYFMQKKYDNAAEVYEEASKFYSNGSEIYPMYQSAISYGLISDVPKKISILNNIRDNYRGSYLYSQSVYELGRTYVQSTEYQSAIECFNQLINDSDSSFHAKSMLELGMTYFNMSNTNKALQYYKTIVQDYPDTQESQNALTGIENIYQNENRIEEYFAYLDNMGLSAIKSDEEKENMLFNSAEQLFLNKQYGQAIKSLKSFIAKYPSGSKRTTAEFYIAESLKNTGELEAASDMYLKVMQSRNGSYPEIATLNYANITYHLKKYDESSKAYETLLNIAKLQNNIKEAYLGIIRSKYGLKDYIGTIDDINSLLSRGTGLDDDNKRELYYLQAKSLYATGQREKANSIFSTLAENPFTSEGAESTYMLIQDAYESGDFIAVENRTFSFSEKGTDQKYWLAKSFIVLGDSYAERSEWEQAKATFQSILDGYGAQAENDDISEQVKIRLEAINREISKIRENGNKTTDNQ